MTTSISTKTKNILCIKMKGRQDQPSVEWAEGPDEDGIRWVVWYLEKNTCDEVQCALVKCTFTGMELYDLYIDSDVTEEVSDLALLTLVKVVN